MGAEMVRVNGLEQLKAKFEQIPRALRAKVLRQGLVLGARLVRDEARRKAPVLSGSSKAPYRKPRTVQKAISVRTSKVARREGNVGVFVNVKPLPGNKYKTVAKQRTLVKRSARGANNPNDPFYWRWLEFGTKKMGKREFLKKAAGRLGDALTAFEQHVGKWIAAVDAGGPIK